MELQQLLQLISSCLGLKNISGITIADIFIIVVVSVTLFSMKKEIRNLHEIKADKTEIDTINKTIEDGFSNLSTRIHDVYNAIKLIDRR
jgi:hypothetical protein